MNSWGIASSGHQQWRNITMPCFVLSSKSRAQWNKKNRKHNQSQLRSNATSGRSLERSLLVIYLACVFLMTLSFNLVFFQDFYLILFTVHVPWASAELRAVAAPPLSQQKQLFEESHRRKYFFHPGFRRSQPWISSVAACCSRSESKPYHLFLADGLVCTKNAHSYTHSFSLTTSPFLNSLSSGCERELHSRPTRDHLSRVLQGAAAHTDTRSHSSTICHGRLKTIWPGGRLFWERDGKTGCYLRWPLEKMRNC